MPFVDARYYDHVEVAAEADKWREKGHTAQVRKAAPTPQEAAAGHNQVWVIEISAQPKEAPKAQTVEEALREEEEKKTRRESKAAQEARAEERIKIQRERLFTQQQGQFARMAGAARGPADKGIGRTKRKIPLGVGTKSGGVRATKARARLSAIERKFGAGGKPAIARAGRGLPRIAQAPPSRPRIAESGLGTGVTQPVISKQMDLSKLRWP